MSKICRISLVGQPNAGKSTLLNCLLKRKVAIVSPKANTTRFAVSGSCNEQDIEIQITDTPGLESRPQHALGRALISAARSVLQPGNFIGLVIDAAREITTQDYNIYQEIVESECNLIVILTKMDLLQHRTDVLPKIELIQSWGYKGVVWLVSSRSEKGIDKLRSAILENQIEEDIDTCHISLTKEKFAAECTREHAFRLLNQEIPYGLWVETKWLREDEVQKDNPDKKICHIEQYIKVLHDRHKAIVLGAKGQMIKRIGSRTRHDLMRYWNQKVRLFLTVKVGDDAGLLESCQNNIT